MKDMFDYLEEDREGNYIVFLCKKAKNKKNRRKLFYLYFIDELGNPVWGTEPNIAYSLSIGSLYYELIKKVVREKNISCQLYKLSLPQFIITPTKLQPVKKETWWNRIKVWFSRKVQYFAGYISIKKQ